MPVEEAKKQNICFAAKMLVESEFIADVESWLKHILLLLVKMMTRCNLLTVNPMFPVGIPSGKVHAVINTVTTVLNLQLHPKSCSFKGKTCTRGTRRTTQRKARATCYGC